MELPDTHSSNAQSPGTIRTGRRGPPKGTPKPPGSGRKPGTPNRVTADLKALAAKSAPKMLAELKKLALEAKDERTRLAAIIAYLNRGLGTPTQSTEISGPNGSPIRSEDVTEVSDIAAARRIAFMFDEAARKMLPPGSPMPKSWAATKAVVAGDPDWQDLPEEIEAREKEDREWRARFLAKPLQADPETAEKASASMSARWNQETDSKDAFDRHITAASDAAFQRMNAPKAITSSRFRNRNA
jgi:hypothetical protein